MQLDKFSCGPLGHRRARIRLSMTHWHPGKQQRRILLASLNGSLDAIASMQGRYRDHMMHAGLLPKRGRTPELVLRAELAAEPDTRVVSISAPAHWTDVEHYLRDEFLQAPFSKPAHDFDETLADTRKTLAFKASDLVMFLAPGMEPGDLWRAELSHPHANRYTGCLIDYDGDILWLWSLHRHQADT
jgi:hypothetical protein